MTSCARPRGRPPRIARDIAVLLAVEWHERAEGLATVEATRAVRGLWHSHGRIGLGRPSRPSKAAFACMRRAAHFLGIGRIVVLGGVEAGDMLTGAAAFFVPAGSELRFASAGRRQAIHGPFWRWPFCVEEAEFVSGNRESPSVGAGRVQAPPHASLGQGSSVAPLDP